MKRSWPNAVALLAASILAGASLGLASCASGAKAPAEPEPAAPDAQTAASEEWVETPIAPVPAPAPKVAKERTVIVKVALLAKESSFYSDGLLDEYAVYKYDESRTRLLEKTTYDAARPDPIERVVSEWKEGRLVADTVFESDGRIRLRREYGYDAAGKLASERVLDAKGILQSSSAYAYDKAGNKAEWRAFDGKGLLKAITVYTYSPALIDMRDPAGKTTGTIEIEAGLDGKPIKKSYRAADGSLQKYEAYGYAAGPAQGPATLESRRADGSLASKLVNTYGALGELLESKTLDGSGALRDSRRYEYLVREDSKTETYYE